jgi:hypothetical protein
MNKMTICKVSLIVLADVFALPPLVAAQSSSQAAPKTVSVTGTVSCSRFAGAVIPRKGFTVAETIRLCINQGGDYTLVSGKNIYPLQGDKKQLWAMAGEKVTVTGNVVTDRPEGLNYAYQAPVQATTIVPSAN